MNDKKHIDRLFQEKFKDFEATPSEHVWEGIEARLQNKKKKRRIIPIWWQLGGVAAALLLLFAVGKTIFSRDANTNVPIVKETMTNKEIDSKEINSSSEEKSKVVLSATDKVNIEASEDLDNNKTPKSNETTSFKNNTLLNSRKSKETVAQNSASKQYQNNTNITDKTSEKDVNSVIASNEQTNKNKSPLQPELKSKKELDRIINSNSTSSDVVVKSDANTEKLNEAKDEVITNKNITEQEKGQDIEEAIAEANKINEEEKESRRWSIAPNVAPVYFNSLGEGSSIDPQFNSNNRRSDISMSYGLKGSYAVNKRLKITAGFNRVNFNSTTSDVIAISDNSFSSVTDSASRLQNVSLNNSVNDASLMVMSRSSLNQNTISEAIKTLETGDLEQRFGFIEIPLEVEYRLIDKKIGVNISSGFSTLLLNENDIFADVNGESTLIGEANNLNNTSFSANFGVGIDYNITEKLNINLEPKFKYQLNTFNNTSGDFRPFFIGVYTGLNFKF
ncbi:hypothetical protein DFQ05_1534 [Winogradskyella wandonensis]|uniref:Outer membrane protein with beta-barrel domain n=1 Tax=Winogradskyella wandonensis TaxID=1442586 RepID=A0A4R1KT62_9FLAO|nr:hypothetical protein [Winogradskyella wandonensis]TCK67753.1 hypothetical protein DFQ05_1534 [Winogradskyella wandonensis]